MKMDEETLKVMQDRGGTWAAYVNSDFGSDGLGHIQALRYGPGCTYETPPRTYPADTKHGMGWRYILLGRVNLQTGEIDEKFEFGTNVGAAHAD